MGFRGHLDVADEFTLHGWAHSETLPNLPINVDIVINRRHVGTVLADSYRQDLEAAQIGDGRKAFWFNPLEYLTEPQNTVEVYFSGTDELLYTGRQIIQNSTVKEDVPTLDLRSKAETRWRGDEENSWLTWGSIMTGDTFLDEVEKHFRFSSDTRIIEIGPGYGRLLKTILQRDYPFRSFQGIDLSQARIGKLKNQFTDARIQFEVGNCSDFPFDESFDLALSSATFEHLFPSMEQTLVNLRSRISTNGMLFIDFILQDKALAVSKAYFEQESSGGAYIRIYSSRELESFFEEAGFTVVAVTHIVLGTGAQGESINRALVCAKPR